MECYHARSTQYGPLNTGGGGVINDETRLLTRDYLVPHRWLCTELSKVNRNSNISKTAECHKGNLNKQIHDIYTFLPKLGVSIKGPCS